MCISFTECLQRLWKKFSCCYFHVTLIPHPFLLTSLPHMQTWQLEETMKQRSKGACLCWRMHAIWDHQFLPWFIFLCLLLQKQVGPQKSKISTTRHAWWKVLCVYAMCINGRVQIHCWVRKPSFCTIHYKEYCEYFTLQDSMQTRQGREREPGGGVA